MEKITFQATIDNLRSMLAFIDEGAKALGFDEQRIHQIMVASEEALVNVINYAYPEKPGEIEVVRELRENKSLMIEIKDSGIAFDPLSLPEPNIHAPMERRRPGGLGIYMIRKIMDEVRYKREGQYNILTMVKNQ
ncbi:MAG: ATP-binding protein [Candidatus Omnitrophica bacterium]|nr:ATP-binding protein [Candidatus Omnitrophota bacterium]MDD5654378.1 ATP-binding protein [Candidatus Omnitrophota bacterium]